MTIFFIMLTSISVALSQKRLITNDNLYNNQLSPIPFIFPQLLTGRGRAGERDKAHEPGRDKTFYDNKA